MLGAFLYFLDRRDGFLEGTLAAQNITDSVFFAILGVLTHKRGGIAKLLVCLVLAVHESGEDVDLGGQRFIVEEERGDLRRGRLAVAVDATVALLDADERPGDVVVDEVVTLGVEIDAFRGDVAGDEDSNGCVLPFELIDDCHLLLIRHAAVEDLDGPLLELELLLEVLLQPGKRGDALGEYNCARRATRADANGFELFDQGGELLGVVRSDLVIELGESLEGLAFLWRDCGGREAVVNRLIQRGW